MPRWQQIDSIVGEACAEMEVAASEVGLQQQLEELEALVLQRGLLGPAGDGTRCVRGCSKRVGGCGQSAATGRL